MITVQIHVKIVLKDILLSVPIQIHVLKKLIVHFWSTT